MSGFTLALVLFIVVPVMFIMMYASLAANAAFDAVVILALLAIICLSIVLIVKAMKHEGITILLTIISCIIHTAVCCWYVTPIYQEFKPLVMELSAIGQPGSSIFDLIIAPFIILFIAFIVLCILLIEVMYFSYAIQSIEYGNPPIIETGVYIGVVLVFAFIIFLIFP